MLQPKAEALLVPS